jgi:hypothetical protein
MQPSEKRRSWLTSYEVFRPEAVDAYTTRQAGEPWNTKHPFEGSIKIVLTVLAVAALIFIFLGGR